MVAVFLLLNKKINMFDKLFFKKINLLKLKLARIEKMMLEQ